MGYTSQDDIVAQITAGKYLRRESAKTLTPVHTAGGWHCLVGLNGFPNQGTYPATQDLVFENCDENSGDGTTIIGMPHGGNPGGSATKHILAAGAKVVAAAGAPWQLKLVDLCAYYKLSGANVTGTGSRTCINSNTFTASNDTGNLLLTYANDFKTLTKIRCTNAGGGLPTGLSVSTDYWLIRQSATTARVATSYANALAGTYIAYTDGGTGVHTLMCYPSRYANGVGMQALFVVQTAPTAGGPNLTASAYDDPTATPGAGTRAFQGTPTMGAAADAYACRILHSGNAAGRYGPYLPLQGGDLGVARINSFTWSSGTPYTGAGVVALCLVKPIFDLMIPVSGLWSENQFISNFPSLPKIENGACLAWLLFGTGATTNNMPLDAALDIGWAG
jgi:hypothetical protein